VAELFRQDGALHGKLSGQQLDLLCRRVQMLRPAAGTTAGLVLLAEQASRSDPPPQALADEIVERIRRDPPLTARLLSLANQRAGQEVLTAGRAVRILGLETVSVEVISAAAQLGPAPVACPLDRPGFWRHCLAVALASEMLAERLALPLEGEEAFVCGLLHDLGKLALAEAVPKSYRRVLEHVQDEAGDVSVFERQELGVDHAAAGRRLAQQWQLPAVVQNVIWMHAQPFEAIPSSLPGRMFVALVGLADAIVRQQRLGFSANYAQAQTPQDLPGRLGISAEAVAEVAETLPGLLDKATEPMQWQGDTGPVGVSKAAGAAAEVLKRANARLRSRGQVMRQGARSFELLSEFFSGLSPAVTVADALGRIAAAMGQAGPSEPTAAEPILAYALSPEDDAVLFVRLGGAAQLSWRTLRCRPGFEPTAPAADSTSAAEVTSAILADDAALGQWVNLSAYRHLKLTGLGRWAGGVLFPSSFSAGQPVREALAEPLGAALAIVQQQCQAVVLAEELAGASDRLARREQMLAAAKLQEAMGDMAAGAAHELNNPLAVVSGRAQHMAAKADNEDERKVWQVIAEQAQRASDLISDLMALTRPPAPRPGRLDPAGLLAEAADAFSSSDHPQAGSARVDIEIEDHTPAVWADRAQIREALVELLRNAAAADAAGPTIRLAAAAGPDGKTTVLTVADAGTGMSAETLSRAMTPFFSRQRAGRRPGLGLPRAKRLVENNAGTIWIRSREGQGTVVYVRLPAAGENAGE